MPRRLRALLVAWPALCPSAAGGLSPDHLRCFFDDDFAAWVATVGGGVAPAGPGAATAGVGGGGGGGGGTERDDAWLAERLSTADALAPTWAPFGHGGESSDGAGRGSVGARRGRVGAVNDDNVNDDDDDDAYDKDGGGGEGSAGDLGTARALPTAACATAVEGSEPPETAATAPLPPRLVTSAAEVARRFLGASVIVGLHPDAATEPLVDFALAHRIPFAVVPCCVHARAAPKRSLPTPAASTGAAVVLGGGDGGRGGGGSGGGGGEGGDLTSSIHPVLAGRPVRTYEDFVTYLSLKSHRVRTAELPIDGRATVLFVASYDDAS